MGLDLSKLESMRHLNNKTVARCPACAETGNDRKGEHLFIEPGGRFGCVVYPGAEGRKHRQKIFELAGIKEKMQEGFNVKKPLSHLVLKNKDNSSLLIKALNNIPVISQIRFFFDEE